MLNIAIFGGSFDPFHNGHSHIVSTVVKLDYIDKCIIVPNNLAVHKKKAVASVKQRLDMIREGLKTFSESKIIDICLHEVSKDEPSWFVDTLKILIQENPSGKFFLVLGEDSFLKFHLWRDYQYILDHVSFIVFPRISTSKNMIFDYGYQVLNTSKLILIEQTLWPVSSEQIRLRCRFEKSYDDFLPKPVYQYILKNNVYKSLKKTNIVLGITGRVGVGKTSLADFLCSRCKFNIIDLDKIGHDLLSNPEVISKVVSEFGCDVLDNNRISREKLGSIVFSNHDELIKLNAIIHPKINQTVFDLVTKSKENTLIVGALINEIGLRSCCDQLLLVDVFDSILERRLKDRIKILKLQRSRIDYMMDADIIVSNDYKPEFFEYSFNLIKDIFGAYLE